jgi:hypothetical protein
MKCPDCNGQGYVEPMRHSARPPLQCMRCEAKGVLPDPKPVPFRSSLVAARRRRRP